MAGHPTTSSKNLLKRKLLEDCPPNGNISSDASGDCPPNKRKLSGNIPLLAYLELTPACNNRCPGCLNESFVADFQTRSLKPEFQLAPLPLAKWQEVLSRLPSTITSLSISGGEPTLHPAFEEIVTELNERGLDFVIFTNARWRTPDRLINLLKELDHFQGFLISLHGAHAEVHDGFTGITSSFDETVKNIRRATSSGLTVGISTVITCSNFAETNDIAQLAEKLGASKVTFNRYINAPHRIEALGPKALPPTPQQLRKAVMQIEAMKLQMPEQIQIGYGPCIPQCFISSSSEGCAAGEISFVVDPWGNVKPCLHTDLLCGNLLHQSFDSIWNSISLQQWRGLLDNECSTCSALAQCGGGCRAMNLAWGQGRDPLMREAVNTSSELFQIESVVPFSVIAS